MGRAYGRKKRAAHRQEAARLQEEIERLERKVTYWADRADETARWLHLALDAALLLEHPAQLGPVPEGALAAGGFFMRISDEEENFNLLGSRRRAMHRTSKVEGELELCHLSRRFAHIGQLVTLTAGAGTSLIVRLEEDSVSQRPARGDLPSCKLKFFAVSTPEQPRPWEPAQALLLESLSRKLLYVVGLEVTS